MDMNLWHIVTDQVLEFGFLGTRNQPKMSLSQVKQRLSPFICQIFGTFDDFSKFRSAFKVHHFEKSSNMPINLAKIDKNPCSTCLLNPHRRPESKI